MESWAAWYEKKEQKTKMKVGRLEKKWGKGLG
jgi:hypothetical protein